MSEKVKPCGAYVNTRTAGSWLTASRGCQKPGVAEGGRCKAHAAGEKRSNTSRAKAEAKWAAGRAEDQRRKAAFDRFIAEMDGSKAVKSGTLAVYNEIREHLRMQMVSMRGYVVGPQEKETK